ncbi:tubulin alpha-4 chain [Reticulomyxa filosa]|uniref:Tubulin alpha-4 chain n=1 Tax=Reticulomyxa filosa TaxID=46433 RepID=X6LIM3_RETFI|nr:tubulin alpha-4 chain [Reticulomyxa filosa]|eukprot:ETO00992.1 tubulin alpha-4 chain [Reticulomyxa filosa]
MAISLNYFGDIKSKEANATVQWSKSNNKVALVEWCSTGFKISLNEVPAVILESDDVGIFSKNSIMVANNTGISRLFSKRIAQKYDLMMYSQRVFVHWHVGEVMEELAEAREDLGLLEKDYLDVLIEQPTDGVGGNNAGDDAGDNSIIYKKYFVSFESHVVESCYFDFFLNLIEFFLNRIIFFPQKLS